MKIDVKELLEDDSFDPKKLFDNEEYNTLIIKREGFSKKENNNADLIENLLEKHLGREEKEIIFKALKDNKAEKLLMDSITKAERDDERAALLAACWESGLDFDNELMFFVKYAFHKDFQVALEALTMVENWEGKSAESEWRQALEMAETTDSQHKDLLKALIGELKSRLGL